ncbi:M48 family metallopeptidase [Streptomyces sp. BI20]|uniref:M48 family metallopeptidase n=1 Tax=Streptomyces sp. BI20 TaxID=3403460 RepID=UPI003C73E753
MSFSGDLLAMGASLRAARALVLLVGFHALGPLLTLLPAALGLGLWALVGGRFLPLAAVSATVLLGMNLARTAKRIRPPAAEPHSGTWATPETEPELWRAVRELADAVGTRAPDAIRIVPDASVAVTEESGPLGTRPGPRILYLGMPLLLGLDQARLRFLLARELARHAPLGTRRGPAVGRGLAWLRGTVAELERRAEERAHAAEGAGEEAEEERAAEAEAENRVVEQAAAAGFHVRRAERPERDGALGRALERLCARYGRFVLRVTLDGERAHEYAADLAGARIVGRDAGSAALRETVVLAAFQNRLVGGYVGIGAPFGLMPLPGEMFGGLPRLLRGRPHDAARLRDDLPDEPGHPLSPRPALLDRVARLEILPDDGLGVAALEGLPAQDLLDNPIGSAVELEEAVLAEGLLGMERLDWEELVRVAMFHRSLREAAAVSEAAAAAGVPLPPLDPAHLPAADPDGAGGGEPAEAPVIVLSTRRILDAIDADPGVLHRTVDRFPKSDEAGAATGRAAREFARTLAREALDTLVTVDLLVHEEAHWALSWSGPAEFHHRDPGLGDRIDEALDAAVADRPDTDPLRRLLPA